MLPWLGCQPPCFFPWDLVKLYRCEALDFIHSSLASHMPFTWTMISYESPWMTSDSTPNALARSKPLIRASYSVLLLVVKNYRRMAYSRRSPSSDCNTTPIPLACWVDEPSTQTTHSFAPKSLFCWWWAGVNSEMKSIRAWAFIASLGHTLR